MARPASSRRLRVGAHLLCALPLAWLAARGLADDLGANPIEAVIRFLGDWALRGLVVALAVTPLRRLTGWSRLAQYRRMLGLWAFTYAALHMASYVGLDQFFDWNNIGIEILKHKFITAGMTAFVLLLPLAATSTAGMMRRLGGQRWRRLHQLVYAVAPLAAVHYIWMVKADIRQPLVYAFILLVLLAFRAFWAMRRSAIA
ncbi:MAG TPA: sulfoxide reductase heme-binding subunit YedZ [Rhodospirillaceae bacterium]|nr:sulfoxide reductase heme-binding subunit YedZ [Rhodospirillaceae bacterium]